MVIKKTRKEVNKDYNAKRLKRPKINVVSNVPDKTIQQLDALALVDGTKKKAILRAIQERYEKTHIGENQEKGAPNDYALYIDDLFKD